MERNIEITLEIETYIQKIKDKSIYHNELPSEIQNDISVIHAEVSAKTRRFHNRGYDVTRNRFFVKQTINERDNSVITEKEEETIFYSFSDYYTYLNGNIYTSSCYFQYQFSEEIINTYNIDIKKISIEPFEKDTLAKRSKSDDEKERKSDSLVEKQANKVRNNLLSWKEKFCHCSDYDELLKVVNQYKKSSTNNWNYVLSVFALCNPQKNIPLIVRLLLERKDIQEKNLMVMLCEKYGDDAIYDCFNRYNWKTKSEIKQIIKQLQEGFFIKRRIKAYDRNIGFFIIRESIIDPKGNRFSSLKGAFTRYYDNFNDFAVAVDFDLSDCDLSSAEIEDIDLSKCSINQNTKLPPVGIGSAHHSICKYYDAARDVFAVDEYWRRSPDSEISKRRQYEFKYFFDYIAFLENDLSGADLISCEGLSYINDFSQINFTGALLVSSIKEKIGLLKNNEILSFPAVDVCESAATAEMAVINGETLPQEVKKISEDNHFRKIYYISDLHLTHHIIKFGCRTNEDVIAIIRNIVTKITNELHSSDILIIAGDTSSDLVSFELFIKYLRKATKASVVFVLGNHELWAFEGTPLKDIVLKYREIIDNAGMYLLHNNVIYKDGLYGSLKVISQEELLYDNKSEIKEKLLTASVILFGGIGFSGLNNNINANEGIYKGVLSRQEEIEESLFFETMYTKIRDSLPDRNIIVATHMPLIDWSHDVELHAGYVYLNGHTHRNEMYDDGTTRIYANNQVGYNQKSIFSKYFYIDKTYDLFADYCDGIYEITRNQYMDFYAGKNINIDFNRDFTKLYMLKRNGYYCFIIENDNKKLYILHGGSTKIIKNKSIESCYTKMENIVKNLKGPLDRFTAIQKQLADLIKNIGGTGRIHGTIIDIDFYNHIYVNPNDLKITAYFAESMVEKIVYGSIQGLLTERRPDMLSAFNKYLSADSSDALVVQEKFNSDFSSCRYTSTDIYSASRIINKIQRLQSNILTIWPDDDQSRTGDNPGQVFLENE